MDKPRRLFRPRESKRAPGPVAVAAVLPAIEPPPRLFAQVELDVKELGKSFDQLRWAARRLFLWLWRATNFGTEPRRFTDREMAEGCGRSLRWVQKALRQLLGHGQILGQDPDAESEPKIRKWFVRGPREVAGRMIEIVRDFARPKDQPPAVPKPEGPPPPAKAPRPAPSPPPASAVPPDPEEPIPPGMFRKVLDQLIGGATPAPAGKTEADRRAEADAKRAAYEADKARRAALKAPAPSEPDPKPRE
jgi:hypothetical protein